MFDKVAVVGESDLVFAFRAIGMKIFSPENLEEARKIMDFLSKENFAICLLHESFFEPLKKEREILGEKFCPVVLGFSDYREITTHMEKMMRDTAIKATGSDSLVKRRGKNETR